MAQPSANREPTMEEILASIRRIIESNDTAGAEDAAASAEVDDDYEAETVVDELTASNDDVVRADAIEDTILAAPASVGANGRSESAFQPVSLAEVAARVRASGSAAVLSKAAPATVASLSTRGSAAYKVDPEVDVPDGESTTSVAAAAPAFEEPAIQEPDFDMDELSADLAVSAANESIMADEAGTVGQDATTPSAAADTPVDSDARLADGENKALTHLMSAHTGAKVSAAFEDLSEMFAEGQRRSFDEMAEEMLRPMLQQWLDDNLPTLVERLVREEIERVARGSRR